MSNKAWGGRRDGAGRPKLKEKRKLRTLAFLDHEWELIREKAKEKKLSPREYLYGLVEKDF